MENNEEKKIQEEHKISHTEILSYIDNHLYTIHENAKKYFKPNSEMITKKNLPLFLADLQTACNGFDFMPVLEFIHNESICFSELITIIREFLDNIIVVTTPAIQSNANTSKIDTPDLNVPTVPFVSPAAEKIEEIPKEVVSVPVTNSKNTINVDEIEEQLKIAISKYENLLKLQMSQGVDIAFTQKLLSLMHKQLNKHKSTYQKDETQQNNKSFSKHAVRVHPGLEAFTRSQAEPDKYILNEKQVRGLKEIFQFYCKQQQMLGKKVTFDKLMTCLSHMTIGEFTKFCKDFKVPIKTNRIKEIFKGKPYHGKELDWDKFIVF